MSVYKITVALLSFLNRRLKAAAAAEYAAADKIHDAIEKLEDKADQCIYDARKADVLAAKLDDLVQ